MDLDVYFKAIKDLSEQTEVVHSSTESKVVEIMFCLTDSSHLLTFEL